MKKGSPSKLTFLNEEENKPNRNKADTERCLVSAFYHISGKKYLQITQNCDIL